MNLSVCELFAGVGGFRLGLEKSGWEVIWSNQWEPKKKAQHASDCYVAHFGPENHICEDIAKILAKHIPEHSLLVGGFPCQDYSVAATGAKGIKGKTGVLWWEINRILEAKRPPFVLLENVDRLLVSPSKQRGRDMGVMLACFRDLDYSVEWRVINSGDYGFPQRRRRVFILAFRNDTTYARRFDNSLSWHTWLQRDGFFAHGFPVKQDNRIELKVSDPLKGDLLTISDTFAYRFHNAGVLSKDGVYTERVMPIQEKMRPMSSVLEDEVEKCFYVSEEDLDEWKYAKGAKNEKRVTKAGYEYSYKEGAIPFPEDLSRPSRTMITNEGKKKPNRFVHLIKDPKTDRYRVLTPIEVERLNGFPDGWTDTGMPLSWRYFCMGNALVVGLIERMGHSLKEIVLKDEVFIQKTPTDKIYQQARRAVQGYL